MEGGVTRHAVYTVRITVSSLNRLTIRTGAYVGHAHTSLHMKKRVTAFAGGIPVARARLTDRSDTVLAATLIRRALDSEQPGLEMKSAVASFAVLRCMGVAISVRRSLAVGALAVINLADAGVAQIKPVRAAEAAFLAVGHARRAGVYDAVDAETLVLSACSKK